MGYSVGTSIAITGLQGLAPAGSPPTGFKVTLSGTAGCPYVGVKVNGIKWMFDQLLGPTITVKPPPPAGLMLACGSDVLVVVECWNAPPPGGKAVSAIGEVFTLNCLEKDPLYQVSTGRGTQFRLWWAMVMMGPSVGWLPVIKMVVREFKALVVKL